MYSDTELLVGADNGLYLFNRTTHQFLRMDDPSNPKSLSDQSIFNIFKDREGGIWISTNLDIGHIGRAELSGESMYSITFQIQHVQAVGAETEP